MRGVANILVGAVDASFAADAMTRRSHGGYINFINSGPVSWKSGLQPIVTLSSCESEYVALCAEVCEVKYLHNLMGGARVRAERSHVDLGRQQGGDLDCGANRIKCWKMQAHRHAF